MVENICVNAPGPALLGGSAGGSAAGEEDAEGVAVPGVLPASSPLNMRVNSPGPCGADAAGIADAGAAAAVGALHTGSGAALGLDELKIRVDSPEPCDTGGTAADGADGAGFSFRALNICVKLPGWPAACAGPAACAADSPEISLPSFSGSPAADADGIFSIEIGLKTLASSSEGRETGAPPAASGVRSACSIRVKSPCAAAGDGAGGGTDGAGACAPAITSADGVENNPEAGGAEAATGGALTGGTGAAAAGVSAGFWFSA